MGGVDTRRLTRAIRQQGAPHVVLAQDPDGNFDIAAMIARARDWIAVGALTALLAIVFLLLPPDAVTAVGLLCGYLVIVGVYLIIGGFSLKWAAAPAESGTAAETEQQS